MGNLWVTDFFNEGIAWNNALHLETEEILQEFL